MAFVKKKKKKKVVLYIALAHWYIWRVKPLTCLEFYSIIGGDISNWEVLLGLDHEHGRHSNLLYGPRLGRTVALVFCYF